MFLKTTRFLPSFRHLTHYIEYAMRSIFFSSTRASKISLIRSSRRCLSSVTRIADSGARPHVFVSTSSDPFLNLSIEHFIFQNAPAGSKILLLYINRPCIVIGRNQNPWLEVNLQLLGQGLHNSATDERILTHVDLVRRRSGGGTVFHDHGNVNWSFMTDLGEFTRDKHAELVVTALRNLGINRARVNERHDIVLDTGPMVRPAEPEDTHLTPYTELDTPKASSVKISGSAYKIARNRALHHGTALLRSPYLDVIPQFLRSPAKTHITAKGIASVSSPISNVGLDREAFKGAVISAFRHLYGGTENADTNTLDSECLEIPEVYDGFTELKSEEWTFKQTPQFSFQTSSPIYGSFILEVKHGSILDAIWSPLPSIQPRSPIVFEKLRGSSLHEIRSWKSELARESVSRIPVVQWDTLLSDLSKLLPASS